MRPRQSSLGINLADIMVRLPDNASMRPRQSSLGIRARFVKHRGIIIASMRPRQSSLGIKRVAYVTPEQLAGFNEAEAIKPRNPSPSV